MKDPKTKTPTSYTGTSSGYGYGGSGSSGYGGAGYGGYGAGGYGAGGYGGGNYGYGGAAYGGGGYYYGYGSQGGYGANDSPGRSFRDYLLILRERIWIFVITFLIIFLGVALFSVSQQNLYQTSAKVHILRDEMEIFEGPDVYPNTIQSGDDFNTQLQVLRSGDLVTRVAERIRGEREEQLVGPYRITNASASATEILASNLKVRPVRQTFVVEVGFEHPDPSIARDVSNFYAEEFINYNVRLNIDTAMSMVEDLRVRVENQRERVEEIRNEIADYTERTGRLSLEEANNIERSALQQMNSQKVAAEAARDNAQSNWELIQEARASGRPLYEVPSIGGSTRVQSLVTQLQQHRIAIADLRQLYRDSHPKLMAALEKEAKIQEELDVAMEDVATQIELTYQTGQEQYEKASRRLAQKEREILDLSREAVEYRSLQDRLGVAESLFSAMEMRLREQTARATLTGPNARIIDRARLPGRPFHPNHFMNLAFGAVFGGGAGVGLVLAIGLMDDRIKSAYDIETAVGLPLLGIVPRIKRMNSSEKAQAVASNRERRITESFRAIHSALRVNEAAKAARIMLVTSTSPSEGKSFVVTNLALTFAVHGERTLVLDCDLRMPNIGKSISLPEETRGVTQVFMQEASVKDVIVRDVYPNLDVLTAGRRSDNPTQIFTSSMFEQMIDELADRYDRIIIDSPPIAAVSDVLTLLPFVDGVLYVVKFNAVKRKTARNQVRRILESNTPVFGAVLNQISTAVASYYYSGYYSKSYSSYYGKNAPTPEEDESLENAENEKL